MIESKQNVESTPMNNNYNDMLSDEQDYFSSYNRNTSTQDLLDVQKNLSNNMFSFHALNEANGGARTTMNRTDSVGVFGANLNN